MRHTLVEQVLKFNVAQERKIPLLLEVGALQSCS